MNRQSVRIWPRWSRRIQTRIEHGIGHGHAPVFMESLGNRAVIPEVSDFAPNSTNLLRRVRALPDRPPGVFGREWTEIPLRLKRETFTQFCGGVLAVRCRSDTPVQRRARAAQQGVAARSSRRLPRHFVDRDHARRLVGFHTNSGRLASIRVFSDVATIRVFENSVVLPRVSLSPGCSPSDSWPFFVPRRQPIV